MGVTKERLELLMTLVDEISDEMGDIIDGLGDVEEGSKKASKAQEALSKAFKVAQGAAIAAGLAFLKSVPALVDQGNSIHRAETALIAYTGSAGAADAAIRAVSEAAGGSLSKFEATQNATRLFAMGLANTSEEAGKLTAMAITLGSTMGKDASASFEDFSLMLANQSIPRLDSFGISGAEVRARMLELTAANKDLDRQTAFLNATMEIGGAKMEQLAEAGYESTDSVAVLKAQVANFKDNLAVTVADGLTPMITEGLRLKDTINELVESTVTGSDSYDDYLLRMEALEREHPVIYAGTVTLTQAQWAQERATKGITSATAEMSIAAAEADNLFANYRDSTIDLADEISDAASATDDMSGATDKLALSLMKVSEAKIAQEAITALTAAYQDGTITGAAYDAMVKSVMTGFGGMTKKEAEASIALQHLSADFESGAIDAGEYFRAVNKIGTALDNIPTELNVDIWITTHGKVPNMPGKGEKPIAVQHGGVFSVGGQAGIDKVPVSMALSRGETGIIVPRGGFQPSTNAGSVTNINLGGVNYNNSQPEPMLRDDIAMLEMMYGRPQ